MSMTGTLLAKINFMQDMSMTRALHDIKFLTRHVDDDRSIARENSISYKTCRGRDCIMKLIFQVMAAMCTFMLQLPFFFHKCAPSVMLKPDKSLRVLCKEELGFVYIDLLAYIN